MKKPVILLVDDDPAVLQALEASLTPIFEQICRVEAFDKPQDVLDSTTRWTEEEVSIAVAIVDQKMPGLSGVELLAELRQTPPCASMRAILLTGHAGLDSALAAKNRASIDRYIEKPWNRSLLPEQVRDLIARHLHDTTRENFFEFREVVSEPELRSFITLRRAVFLSTRGIERVKEVYIGMDGFDAVARFFGLFLATRDTCELVGTLRVTGTDTGPTFPVLETIAAADSTLRESLHANRAYPLPMMSYLDDRDAVTRLLQEFQTRQEQWVEPGRLALSPAFRGRQARDFIRLAVGLARHIIESAIALYFLNYRVQNALLTCVPSHARMYRKLGFREARGTTTQFQPMLGIDVTCLHGRPEWLDDRVRERGQSLARRLTRAGAACHCPNFPRCLPEAYVSGDFRDSELFCPAAARELLRQ